MDTEQQTTTLAEAIAATPESVALLMQLGHSLYQQGKLSEARDIFEGLILLDPSNPYAFGILGSIHQQQNQYEQAIHCYSQALQLSPADVNTWTNRGECYLQMGHLNESAQDFKAAIQLDVENSNPAANRARFLSAVTLEALKLAESGGEQAVKEAKRRLDEQLKTG
jgi:tetratricopeptide (TPR) repeat protein